HHGRHHGHGPRGSHRGFHRGCGGAYGHCGPPWRRKRGSLRRRLTVMMALVALAAVVLTTWMTVGAVFDAQRELFQQVDGADAGSAQGVGEGPGADSGWSSPPWRDDDFGRGQFERGPAAEAF